MFICGGIDLMICLLIWSMWIIVRTSWLIGSGGRILSWIILLARRGGRIVLCPVAEFSMYKPGARIWPWREVKESSKGGGCEKKAFLTCVLHPSEIERSTREGRSRSRGDCVLSPKFQHISIITMSTNSNISYHRKADACNKHEGSQECKNKNVQTQTRLVIKIPLAEMGSSREISEPNLTPAIILHVVWA